MVKIIRGGLKQREDIRPETGESIPEFLTRNIGGTAESLIGGLEGLKNLLLVNKNQPQLPVEEFLKPYLPQQRSLTETLFGEGFGQPKNIGESALRFGLREAPLWYATGGLSSLPALGKAATTSLATLLGSEGGSQLGGLLGEQFGARQKGEAIGGLAGAGTGLAAPEAILKRPTKALGPKIYQKEAGQFEAGKATKLAELEKEYAPKINISQARNSYKKDLNEATNIRNEALQNLENQAKTRSSKVEELRTAREPLYTAAKERAKGIKAEAPKILSKLEEINDSLGKGIEKADAAKIRNMISNIEDHIKKGKFALEDAKDIQKNINTKLEEKNAFGQTVRRTVVGEKYKDINRTINDFIAEVGEKYPEHAEVYKPAEAKHQELKKLQRETKNFEKEQRSERQRINKEYKEDINKTKEQYKENQKEIKGFEKEYIQARKQIGKENYDEFIKNKSRQDEIANIINNIKDKIKGVSSAGLGYWLGSITGAGKFGKSLFTLGSYLLQHGNREIKYLKRIFKEHPELYAEYMDNLKDISKKNTPLLINRINEIGQKVQNYLDKERQPEKGKIKIISGGLKS